jgi:hypothetical protein
MRSRSRLLPLWLTVLAALLVLPGVAVAATAPVSFRVAFDRGARLGGDTSLHLSVHVAPRLAPVTELRVLTPNGLEFSSSQLGVASCRRPAVEVVRVMSPIHHNRCPANSLMATGEATAGLVFNEFQTVYSVANVELHAGPSVDDRPGLLLTADAYNPGRIQLTYAGYIYVPPEPFGVGLALKVRPIPSPPFGAPLALSTVDLVVGQSSLVYHKLRHGREVEYHPGGIPLASTCPAGGFRFRLVTRLVDGTRYATDAVVPCPLAGDMR